MKYNYNVAFKQLLSTYPSRQYCFAYIILWWVKTANFAIKMGFSLLACSLFEKKKTQYSENILNDSAMETGGTFRLPNLWLCFHYQCMLKSGHTCTHSYT